jgi:hypothetical protein
MKHQQCDKCNKCSKYDNARFDYHRKMCNDCCDRYCNHYSTPKKEKCVPYCKTTKIETIQRGPKGEKGDNGCPTQIDSDELVAGYSVDNGGLIHPANAKYIEFNLIGGGGGGGNKLFEQLGLDIDGEAADDQSGHSISMNASGTIVVIGAPKNSGVNGPNSGHLRVYEYDGTNWIQLGQDIDGATGSELGFRVSINAEGTIIAGGAIRYDISGGADAGLVCIYEYNGTNWIQLGNNIEGAFAGDFFGHSVGLNDEGTIIVIGSTDADDNGSRSGNVRVYEYVASNWVQLGINIPGDAVNDQSGYSSSINAAGNIIAIGANANDGNGTSSGQVRIYEYDSSNNWVQLGSDIYGNAGDQVGTSVSLNSSGTIIAIGAAGAGYTFIYHYNGTEWFQMGTTINQEVAGDAAGWSVSINNLGTIVAIGAVFNDGNGTDSGHMRIYKYDGLDWFQLGQDIDGEVAGDFAGWTVSINAAGTIAAVGSFLNDGDASGNEYGHTRVYDIQNGAGLAGQEIKIKRKLPGNFSFTIGNGGGPGAKGMDTTLITPTGPIIAVGGEGNIRNSANGEQGYYDGYGAGGGFVNGSGGSDKAGDGTGLMGGAGASGYVLVTYS